MELDKIISRQEQVIQDQIRERMWQAATLALFTISAFVMFAGMYQIYKWVMP